MLGRTRVGSAMDSTRLAALVSGPGIDTRIWESIAYANADSMVSKEGHFVDVTLAPSGYVLTCQVATDDLAPGGYGRYRKVHADDELLVEIPDGDPNHGGVVKMRLFSNADPPPQEAIDNPDDAIDHIEGGKNYRHLTTGGGKSYFHSDTNVIFDSPKVDIGGEDASQALILGSEFRSAQVALDTILDTQLGLVGLTYTPIIASNLLLAATLNAVPMVGGALALPFFMIAINAGFVPQGASFAAMQQGYTQFETTTDDFLSKVGFTK